MIERMIKIFHHNYLFGHLGPGELAQLATIATECPLKKGDILFSQGDVTTHFYLIAFGQVDIIRYTPQGDAHLLHQHINGELVAEATIFELGHYPASARILGDSLLLKIPKKEFLDFLAQHPSVMLKLLSAYARRIRNFLNTIEFLSLHNPYLRLLKFLLTNGLEDGKDLIYQLKGTKKDLASILGLSPETLSRSLKQLKAEEVLVEKDKELRLINYQQWQKKNLGVLPLDH